MKRMDSIITGAMLDLANWLREQDTPEDASHEVKQYKTRKVNQVREWAGKRKLDSSQANVFDWRAQAGAAEKLLAPMLMPADRKVCLYLAGPMTGIPDFNYPRFNEKAAELRGYGWDVWNPAEIGETKDASFRDYMRGSIAMLLRCNFIYVLKGWEKSIGTAIELDLADTLGIYKIFEEDEDDPKFTHKLLQRGMMWPDWMKPAKRITVDDVKEAYREGYQDRVTYNDVAVTSFEECWEGSSTKESLK